MKAKTQYMCSTVSNEQSIRIKPIFAESFENNSGINVNDFELYDVISNEQYVAILNEFYAKVYDDPIANPDKINSADVDIGIIREGKFQWLQQCS